MTKFSIITFQHVPLASSDKFGGSLQRVKRSTFYETGKTLALKTSLTLDQLLGSHYSKRIRPDFGRKQVKVKLNLSIRSMVRLIDCMIFYSIFFQIIISLIQGPVSENSQSFYLDCYFRQSWVDPRLSFNVTGVQQLPMNWQFLTKVWKPDTFFLNGYKSKLHKITVSKLTYHFFIGCYPEYRRHSTNTISQSPTASSSGCGRKKIYNFRTHESRP